MTEKLPADVAMPEGPHESPFDRVIAPMTRSAFLSEYWGKSFLHLAGQRGRFSSLLSWDELSSILERHELAPPRFRLVRDGKRLDKSTYLRGEEHSQRLKAAGLVSCLSDGATLVLDAVDDLSPGARAMAEAFEEVLRTSTAINLYAGWRTQHGFDLHWDDQDTVVVQLSGRKHWRVYRPTRLHPLKPDVEEAPKPTGDPVWDGILEDGDVIHLPRGWWHVAFPLDEPTLHLTITMSPAHGASLLGWCVERLKRHAEVRMNVPNLASEADRRRYFSVLRGLVTESLTDELLERFLEDSEAKIALRPHVRLPLAPVEARDPINDATRVRLATAWRLSFEKDETGKVRFHANERRWRCSPEVVPALAALRGTSSHSVRQLCALVDPSAALDLQMLLTALAMGGVVWTEREGER